MATLTIPLSSNDQYYGRTNTWYAPNHYSANDPISAQHIYSITVKLDYKFLRENYTAAWYNDTSGTWYTYVGPGQEPREELNLYCNLGLQGRTWGAGGTYTVFTIFRDKKQIWTVTREELTNTENIVRTRYINFDLTDAEKAALIEHINDVYYAGAFGDYSHGDPDETDKGSLGIMARDPDASHLYREMWIPRYINARWDSCLIIDYLPVGSIKAPSGAYAPSSAPVQNVPILWEEPQKTEQETWDVEITHYAIWRCDTVDGTYVKVGETDGPVLNYSDTTATPGTTWYYKVQACSEEIPLYNSELSAPTAGTYVNYAPEDPDIETGAAGTSYNPRPRILVTLGDDEDNVTLSLAAEGYTPSRATAAPGSKVVFQRTEPMAAGSETVTVSSADPPGNVASEDADVTYTVPTWTDVPIVAGTTVVKAVHINELRAQLENLCDYYGMDAPVWSEDVVAGTTPSVRFAAHATELQNVVRAIANKINTWDAQSSRCNVVLPSLVEPQRPLASVINQLRDIIKIL